MYYKRETTYWFHDDEIHFPIVYVRVLYFITSEPSFGYTVIKMNPLNVILCRIMVTCVKSSVALHSLACFSSRVKSWAKVSVCACAGMERYANPSIRISPHVLCSNRIWSFRAKSVKPREKIKTFSKIISMSPKYIFG